MAASPSSAIPANSKVSAAAACSPSCAPTAASTSSNDCTASPSRGKRPPHCSYAPATRPRSTPTSAHDRIVAGTLEDHLHRIAATWIDHHEHGRSIAVVASTNDHVDTINQAIQHARLTAGHLDAASCDTARRR